MLLFLSDARWSKRGRCCSCCYWTNFMKLVQFNIDKLDQQAYPVQPMQGWLLVFVSHL